MLNAFSARLEARNPAKGHYRSYRIDAGLDLLGEWVVDIRFGRIGSTGTHRQYCVEDQDGAERLVERVLKRRSSASIRIGTGYHLVELYNPRRWDVLEFEQQL